MLLTLIGTVVLGVGVGGTVLLLINVLRLPLPRWMVPAAAGLSMLGFAIYLDYTWFGRLVASLSPRSVVAATFADASPLKPWTFLVRPVSRFVVVDGGSIQPVAAGSRFVQALVIGVARWQPTWMQPMVFDCGEPRRADLHAAPVIGPDGDLLDVDWVTLGADDGTWRVVCARALSPIGQD